MGLTDEVRRVPRSKRAYVERMLGEELDEFLTLLADPTVEATALHAALVRRNIEVSNRTVAGWCAEARRGAA